METFERLFEFICQPKLHFLKAGVQSINHKFFYSAISMHECILKALNPIQMPKFAIHCTFPSRLHLGHWNRARDLRWVGQGKQITLQPTSEHAQRWGCPNIDWQRVPQRGYRIFKSEIKMMFWLVCFVLEGWYYKDFVCRVWPACCSITAILL